MPVVNSVCVYCGSRFGNKEEYRQLANELGVALAKDSKHLVYGGGNVGLMGEVSGSCARAGGRVTGIITEHLLNVESGNRDIDVLEVVADMHIRKARMMLLSDVFVCLPGGVGTLEELFEVLSWAQLDLHGKPIYLLGKRFYQPLMTMLASFVAEGFISQACFDRLNVVDSVEQLLAALNQR